MNFDTQADAEAMPSNLIWRVDGGLPKPAADSFPDIEFASRNAARLRTFKKARLH
jgi:hypothetical protein